MGILWELFCRLRKCGEKKKDGTKYLHGMSVRVISASEAMDELLANRSETNHFADEEKHAAPQGQVQLRRTNNWLKMHGYPMRRRCGRRKHRG